MLRCPFTGYVGCPLIVISGCPEESDPSVFRVGPGPRITYGTGTRTATAIAISVARPAMDNVRERRDMLGRLRAADPLVGTVGEALMLPDRHRGLQLVDHRVAGVERLGAVRAGHAHDDRRLADGQVTYPVHGGYRDHVVLGHDVFGDPPDLRCRGRMSGVRQRRHAAVGVVVPDGADEQHLTAGSGVGDRVAHLVHGQFGVPDGDQPDLAHPVHGIVNGSVTRGGTTAAPAANPYLVLLRARRTIAAVPMTAAVAPAAPAAVSAASLRAIRRPATAWCPARAASSTARASALLNVGCHPAARRDAQSTTHGYTTYRSSAAGAGVTPRRCSRCAVPNVSRAGNSIDFRPLSSSTSAWASQPSLPTAKSPPIVPTAASSSAETRSETWQNCQCGAQPRTASSRGASKCLVTTVSTASPTSAAGRTTVTAVPGLTRRERRASSSISSRSPATLPSVSARSGASSGSGTGLSGRAPYTMALVTRTTRPTRSAAAAVSTVCAARTLDARRCLASVAADVSMSACTTTSTPASRAASVGSLTSATRQVTPPASPR